MRSGNIINYFFTLPKTFLSEALLLDVVYRQTQDAIFGVTERSQWRCYWFFFSPRLLPFLLRNLETWRIAVDRWLAFITWLKRCLFITFLFLTLVRSSSNGYISSFFFVFFSRTASLLMWSVSHLISNVWIIRYISLVSRPAGVQKDYEGQSRNSVIFNSMQMFLS